MSCVNYCFKCNDCKHHDYLGRAEEVCPKCGSDNVVNILEWDERDDFRD